jgi:hypothetical protein
MHKFKKGYKSHNKSVFGCIVLVLVLVNQPDPGPVISLTSCKQIQIHAVKRIANNRNKLTAEQTKHTAPSLELDLETLEVCIGLLGLDKTTLQKP